MTPNNSILSYVFCGFPSVLTRFSTGAFLALSRINVLPRFYPRILVISEFTTFYDDMPHLFVSNTY